MKILTKIVSIFSRKKVIKEVYVSRNRNDSSKVITVIDWVEKNPSCIFSSTKFIKGDDHWLTVSETQPIDWRNNYNSKSYYDGWEIRKFKNNWICKKDDRLISITSL